MDIPRRKNKTRTLPFEEARRYSQRYSKATSRNQYYKWFKEHGPKFLPKYPYRAYQYEWISWNDWLGTRNSFGPMIGDFCPYWEAVRFTQKLGLKTAAEWKAFTKTDKMPQDIPKSPVRYYDEWKGKGWDVWLGVNIHSKIEAAKNDDPIIALIHAAANPPNVIMVSVLKDGMKRLKELQATKDFTVLRAFVYEEELMPKVNHIINTTSSAYEDDEKIRLVPNVSEMMWQLTNVLLIKKI